MATNGIVVMVSYAQYFNAETDACTKGTSQLASTWRAQRRSRTTLMVPIKRTGGFSPSAGRSPWRGNGGPPSIGLSSSRTPPFRASWMRWPAKLKKWHWCRRIGTRGLRWRVVCFVSPTISGQGQRYFFCHQKQLLVWQSCSWPPLLTGEPGASSVSQHPTFEQ